MSGKFIKTKKVAVSILAMLMVVSQLMGCVATTKEEAVALGTIGEQIEVEMGIDTTTLETTETAETGDMAEAVEVDVVWEALDVAEHSEDFRNYMDKALMIVKFGEGSKNGILFVGKEEEFVGNNTMLNAFRNDMFYNMYWEDDIVQLDLGTTLSKSYLDLDYESEDTKYAVLNEYYNLFATDVAEFNALDTLTREQAYIGVAKAMTEYSESGNNKATLLDKVIGQSYLGDFEVNKKISRGEFIYLLMQANAETFDSVEMESKPASDCELGEYMDKDAEQLVLALKEVKAPKEMYDAVTQANSLGIIDGESNWDEALTKVEAIKLITKTFEAVRKHDGLEISAKMGAQEGEIVEGSLDESEAPGYGFGNKQDFIYDL